MTTIHKAPTEGALSVLVAAGLMTDPKGTLNVIGLVVFSLLFRIFLANIARARSGDGEFLRCAERDCDEDDKICDVVSLVTSRTGR